MKRKSKNTRSRTTMVEQRSSVTFRFNGNVMRKSSDEDLGSTFGIFSYFFGWNPTQFFFFFWVYCGTGTNQTHKTCVLPKGCNSYRHKYLAESSDTGMMITWHSSLLSLSLSARRPVHSFFTHPRILSWQPAHSVGAFAAPSYDVAQWFPMSWVCLKVERQYRV